nr:MAG TPA: hypothetical protein [Caudoviricetes sp.]
MLFQKLFPSLHRLPFETGDDSSPTLAVGLFCAHRS